MSLQIFIARHGQNEDNANGILNGHRDKPLTDLGREQARDLGLGIKGLGLKLDSIYSSPLSRAFETAEIVSEILDMPKPLVLDGLIERDFGIMTGKTYADIETICGDDLLRTEQITYFLSPKNAETFPELLKRADLLLKEVRSRHNDGNIMLVCHGDFGKMLYASATGKNWEDVLRHFHFGNGELIDIAQDDVVHVIKLDQHNS